MHANLPFTKAAKLHLTLRLISRFHLFLFCMQRIELRNGFKTCLQFWYPYLPLLPVPVFSRLQSLCRVSVEVEKRSSLGYTESHEKDVNVVLRLAYSNQQEIFIFKFGYFYPTHVLSSIILFFFQLFFILCFYNYLF
jgi:hypothetical protein